MLNFLENPEVFIKNINYYNKDVFKKTYNNINIKIIKIFLKKK